MVAEFRIDSSALNKFTKDLKEFEPALYRGLRKTIKSIGEKGAAEVRKTVRMAPPSGGSESRGSRGVLAGNTKVTMSFSSRSAGVKIVTRAGSLGTFAKGYNQKKPFRVPVLNSPGQFRDQQGRPYFGASIIKVVRARLAKEISDAVDDAFRAMKATNI